MGPLPPRTAPPGGECVSAAALHCDQTSKGARSPVPGSSPGATSPPLPGPCRRSGLSFPRKPRTAVTNALTPRPALRGCLSEARSARRQHNPCRRTGSYHGVCLPEELQMVGEPQVSPGRKVPKPVLAWMGQEERRQWQAGLTTPASASYSPSPCRCRGALPSP